MSDTIKSLAGSMLTAAQKVVDTAKYDRTRRGIIKSVQSNGYVVDVYGIEYTASGTPGAHKVGDVVSVLFEQNNPDTCLVLNSYARTAIDDLITVRPNLLDNWYFVGGGSQQGGGKFPINQRGETSWSDTNVMSVDRWVTRKTGGTLSISLAADGLHYTGSGASARGLNQTLENIDQYLGKTVTVSVLVKDVSVSADLCMRWSIYNASSRNTHATPRGSVYVTGDGLYTVTTTLPTTWQYSYLNVGFYQYANTTASLTIVAAKLELGDTQTLAHQENGVWVLNELPNYQEQLARCQRHLYVMNTYGATDARFAMGQTMTGTTADFLIEPPVPMRTVPTLTTSGSLAVIRASNSYTATYAIDSTGSTNDRILVVATKDSSTWTTSNPCQLKADNDATARLIFSAEL